MEEALEICRQIAEGLEAAHEKGHHPSGPEAGQCQDHSGRQGQDSGLWSGQSLSNRRLWPQIFRDLPTLTDEMTRARGSFSGRQLT